MTLTKRQERHLRTLAALPADNLQPEDYATLDALIGWAREEIGVVDRKAKRATDAKQARKDRQKARDGDGVLSEAEGYALVDERSGGRCEHPLHHILSVELASVHHHIAGRDGSNPHHPDNLLHLCDPCHRWTHCNPERSYELGTMRKRTGVNG